MCPPASSLQQLWMVGKQILKYRRKCLGLHAFLKQLLLQTQPLPDSTQRTVQQNLQALSSKGWGKVLEKRTGRNQVTTCTKKLRTEGSVRIKGSKIEKNKEMWVRGHQKVFSMFPESIQGTSGHCQAVLCPAIQENNRMETDTLATHILPSLPGAGNSHPGQGQQADENH